MDETHFIFNMDDNRTLEFKGAKRVTYQDVVSSGEGMTLIIKLRGGRNACTETPLMIFTSSNSSYPIRGVEDVPGLAYRSGPRGWMDRRVFCEWLHKDRCVRRDPHNRTQVIFMDNCAHKVLDHIEDEDKRKTMLAIMATKQVELRFLPANATDYCQPADVAVIQKVKQV